MSDTSTDEHPQPRPGDDPDLHGQEDGTVEDDGPAEPPVIGCTRCEARVVMGSRYCPSCGVPLVRSGEQAATALSRTRRRAPWIVRLLVPLLFIGVLYAIWYVANTDPIEDEKDDLQQRLTRVVDGHRTLSDRLEELEADTDPDAALGAARAALATLRDVQDETEGVDSGTTGRTTRVRRALATDRLYLSAVVGVLQNPRSPLLDQLGRRSARAVAALRSVDDIAPTKDAIRGTAVLGESVRARAKNPSGSRRTTTSSSSSSAKRPPFVSAVERVIRTGSSARPELTRGFALLRAARDGISTWDGTGARPTSADAAVAEAERLFTAVARARTRAAGQARDVTARQSNQEAIRTKLAAAYEAGGATATKVQGCIGSFQNTPAQGIARQCLDGVRPQSATEADRTRSFVQSYRSARVAAGLGATPVL
ncbi:hypothetical protein [Patulibacter sp.]|uniref:hypothetical protein n=1 Tax=Patulibacter sp. TaxID=1912859 RepID=UPI0027216447|nr:hypothetical protein [Patulibacter sp.]MDO9407503.1 hypothetical protein [Patulibacter sp.]